MAEIKVRNAAHSEFSFSTLEEFATLVRSGGITSEWEIWHRIAARWVPVTRHPLFATGLGEPTTEGGAQAG